MKFQLIYSIPYGPQKCAVHCPKGRDPGCKLSIAQYTLGLNLSSTRILNGTVLTIERYLILSGLGLIGKPREVGHSMYANFLGPYSDKSKCI